MARRRKHQSDQRADLRGAGFIGLPAVVYKSEAYRSLGVFDRAVLIAILWKFNGYNNGKIVVSHREIADDLGNSNFRKISRSIATLIERGLLDISTEAVWKQRLAREYRLTFITSRAPPYTEPASNEYLRWQKNDADGASAEKARSADGVSASPPFAADGVSARETEKRLTCVAGSNSSADDVSALISEPYGSLERMTTESSSNHGSPLSDAAGQTSMIGLGWWSTDTERQLWAQILVLKVVAQNRPLIARAA